MILPGTRVLPNYNVLSPSRTDRILDVMRENGAPYLLTGAKIHGAEWEGYVRVFFISKDKCTHSWLLKEEEVIIFQ